MDAQITRAQLEQVLSGITKDAVLVGGQALAVWIVHYGLDHRPGERDVAITQDADFLGSRDDVMAIAKRVHGTPEFPPQRGITALIGQVRIPAGAGEFANVDVIHRVVGLKADDVRRRAFEVTSGSQSYLVMHPLDVLASRVENLATLAEKQNPQGTRQAHYAVLVAREYIRELAAEPSEKAALKAVERVAAIAKSSAGRNVSRQFGIDFLPAIPDTAIRNEAFLTIRLPRLVAELNQAAGKDSGIGHPDRQEYDGPER